MDQKIRPIAIHLPQFHPIPENDQWWGRGFTEWTNVTKARPLFKGHYQPHLPTDLGFYDLRLPEARQAQADLAREHGLYGFCYYHYWFNGRRLLEKPVEQILKTGQPDFPFMLCWANENWTRRWDGSEQTILMKQEYSEADAIAHCRELRPYFEDPRYIRIDGRPVFAIYRPRIVTDLDRYVQAFRAEAQRAGIDLYLCRVENEDGFRKSPLAAEFDAAIEFQPQSEMLYAFMEHVLHKPRYIRAYRKIKHKTLRTLGRGNQLELALHKERFRLDYNEYVDFLLQRHEYPAYKRFPGLTPMWDNTARRGEKAFLMRNSNPQKYGEWLGYHLANFKPYSRDENLLFINAWNEWAEGNHLEPCIKWGRSYLEVTKQKIEALNPPLSSPPQSARLDLQLAK
jgi:lipopolysaccharide biosynthesis protein